MPVKLFCAILFKQGVEAQPVVDELTKQWGDVECSLGPRHFTHSDYYVDEMGSGQRKMYLVLAWPLDPGELPAIKNRTNELEQKWSVGGLRTVNIDPGYLSRDKLMLATTKDFYHRLYLGSGIYGETTLHFRKGRFRYFSWTYPDYREPDVQALLIKARASLVHELRLKDDGD
jgi:hypothetical protein